jgi:hypothetical protein
VAAFACACDLDEDEWEDVCDQAITTFEAAGGAARGEDEDDDDDD